MVPVESIQHRLVAVGRDAADHVEWRRGVVGLAEALFVAWLEIHRSPRLAVRLWYGDHSEAPLRRLSGGNWPQDAHGNIFIQLPFDLFLPVMGNWYGRVSDKCLGSIFQVDVVWRPRHRRQRLGCGVESAVREMFLQPGL